MDLIPAKFSAAHTAFLPAFAAPWFDPECFSFKDPCTLLGEGNRTVLLDRLKAMADKLPPDSSERLSAFLKSFMLDLEKSAEDTSLPEHMDIRLQSAFGLRMLPAFQPVLLRKPCSFEQALVTDDIAARLTGQSSFPPFCSPV